MPFEKGKSGNPEGKKPGTKSNKTLAWERLGDMIVNEGAEKYKEYLNGLSDKKFAEEFRAILEFFKPKQQRTEISGNIETGPKRIGIKKNDESS